MSSARQRNRHHVVGLVADGTTTFELAVTCEVFGVDRRELADPWYRFSIAAGHDGDIRTEHGFVVPLDGGTELLSRADTVVVHPWGDHPVPAATLDALRRAHRRGARLLSICTGAFVLAEAGLLDGRRATTHWMHTDDFAKLFPAVRLDPRVLYVDEGTVMTSAGTASGIDLFLHVVRIDHGADVANALARRMVVPPHRDGGQAQFVDMPVPVASDGDEISATLAWMVENLAEAMSVEQLADRSNMSPRTFARRFRAATGTTPLQWLTTQRVLFAQRLLETTDVSVERIADQCGLGTAANLRLHFTRILGTSPQAYRRCFNTCGEEVAAG